MDYIAYTIFTDASFTTVKATASVNGEKAARIKRTMRELKGMPLKVGDFIEGCRIDRLDGFPDPA